jgi:hypothetical protein
MEDLNKIKEINGMMKVGAVPPSNQGALIATP